MKAPIKRNDMNNFQTAGFSRTSNICAQSQTQQCKLSDSAARVQHSSQYSQARSSFLLWHRQAVTKYELDIAINKATCAHKKKEKKLTSVDVDTLYGDHARCAHAHTRTYSRTHSQVQLVNEDWVEILQPVPQIMHVSGVRQERRRPTEKKGGINSANQKWTTEKKKRRTSLMQWNILARTEGGAAGCRSSFLRPHGRDMSIERASASGRHPAADHRGPLRPSPPALPQC